ncbi:MAG TPA: VOC family protein [Opitutaceae bacterium]|jgi:catechol 2,3-dioxygenase-like lactoylglutathione lyase family enzyme|nr:VOC family protein [Opitutaceae bacterium]
MNVSFKRFGLIVLAFGLAAIRLPADGASRNFHLPALYHVGFWVRDIGKSRAFYKNYLGFDEPYDLHRANGDLQMVVIKVNERQVILLFPAAAKILPNGDNLDHLGLETDNIIAVHDCLATHGVKTGPAVRGHIGDMILSVKDPDGHTLEITQFEPEGQLLKHQGKNLAATRISNHLLTASMAVSNLEASLHFYRDILGFKEVWRDSSMGTPHSVHLQVPDGTDYLDLRPYEKKPGADPARAVAQFYLEVPDAAKAAEILAQRAQTGGFVSPAMSDDKHEASCIDPDGTRVVMIEKTPSQ